MNDLILTTYDWVPEPPRGYVRDLRVRWALEEAGLAYRVETTPFEGRGAAHFEHQPFGQVPWLSDGDLSIFETGAILLRLAERSATLMPTGASGRSETISWIFGALNSVELASLPWALFMFAGDDEQSAGRAQFDPFLNARLGHLEKTFKDRDWLAAEMFTAADILMADVLRLVDRFDGLSDFPACRAYLARAVARPAFEKALADQLAHFAQADTERA